MKDKIIQSIDSRLVDLGLKRTDSKATDIYMKEVLLDATYKGGTNRVEYEVYSLIDDKQKTIFFFEVIKETGAGLTFKADLETTFQTGLTISKKVKSTKYSLDGKAYDYEFNLGTISKIFREIADENKYAFKMVLNKNKAMYYDPNKKSFFNNLFGKK